MFLHIVCIFIDANPIQVSVCQVRANNAMWSQWQLQAMDLRKSFGVPASLHPWTQPRGKFELKGISQTPRILELMDLAVLQKAMFKHCGDVDEAIRELNQLDTSKKLKDFMAGFFIDVSQNPIRRPWTNRYGVTKCLTTSTCLCSFTGDRTVLPVELLHMQGHTREVMVPNSMAQNSIRDLAGEGMHLACLGSLLYCLRITEMLKPGRLS